MTRTTSFGQASVGLMLAAGLLLTPSVALAQAPQFITNGGFEDSFDFSSWTIEEAFTGSYLVCDANPASAHSGSRSAHFGAHESQYDILSKHLPTMPGFTYRVSFWLASDNIAPHNDSFVVLWDNQPLLNLSSPQSGFSYTYYSFDVLATGYSTELAFLGYKRFGSFRLDDVGTTFAPASDLCWDAPLITLGSWYGDTFSASNDTQGSCGLIFGRDVWYRFVAPCTSTVTMNTCGSDFDTTLSLWNGCGGGEELTCNNDSNGQGPCPSGTSSHLTFPVFEGATYYVRIAGFSAFNWGNYVLNVSMPVPDNDTCATPTPLDVGETYGGSTSCASTEGATTCAPSGGDIWFVYTPNCDHTLELDTCGSTFDTVLSIHDAGCDIGDQVDCSDDRPIDGKGGKGGCWIRTSFISVDVTAGVTYYVRLAGYQGATGDYSLSVSSPDHPSNVSCATATPIFDGETSFDGRCAQQTGGLHCGIPTSQPALWYTYAAECDGPVAIDLCETEGPGEALLSVYAGPCDDLTCISSAELTPTSCPSVGSGLVFDAVAGQQYAICHTQFDDAGLGAGTLLVTPTPPAHDDCSGAVVIGEGLLNGSTRCATPSGLDLCGLSAGSPDVWYRWTAPCDGVVEIDTCGSSYDTVLTVFTGDCGSPVQLACNDDDLGVHCPEWIRLSYIALTVSGGTDYLIRVSGFNGLNGAFTLNLTHEPSASNFSCPEALAFEGDSIDFDARCATGNAARFCDGTLNWPAAWFTYTATCNGPHTLSFCRTDASNEALLTVYSGDCNAPVCLGFRHILFPVDCPGASGDIVFNAIAGETYRICYTQFTGIPLGAGRLTITHPQPANDLCGAATPLEMGANAGDTTCAGAEQLPICAEGGPDVWYAFTPTADVQLTLDTCGSSFDTVVSVFSGDCSNLGLLACNDNSEEGPCPFTSASYLSIPLSAGTTYYVHLTSFLGESGPYILNASVAAANDTCDTAQLIFDEQTVTGSTRYATLDGAAQCDGGGGADVWYRWQPSNCSNRLVLDTCGSELDAVVSVYAGGCGKMTEIACSDNASPDSCGDGAAAHLDLLVSPDSQYLIRVAGAGGTSGDFTLDVRSPRNTSCPSALPVFAGETLFNGQCGAIDSSGVASCGEPGEATLWFSYNAACTGTVSIDLCGSNYDTVLSVHSGVCGGLSELACSDNAVFCPDEPFNAYVEFEATAGQTYTIRVSANDDELSDGRMLIACQATPCSADLNGDGLVDLVDLSILLGHYGLSGQSHENGDLTGDGVVQLDDLGILLSMYGDSCVNK